jgi:hypothetical protein
MEEGNIFESNSPLNSSILVVPKRVGGDGEQKLRLVVDFRCLNEERIGDPILYLTLQKCLISSGNPSFYASGYGDGNIR